MPHSIPIYRDDTVVNGIGGQIHSLGHVYLRLVTNENDTFAHKFHVFNNLPLKADGILGLDFLAKYESKINLKQNTLSLNNNGKECLLGICEKPKSYSDDVLVLPARSESIHHIYLENDLKEDGVVCAKELRKDVFLAGSIVKPRWGKISVKILNLSENDISIPVFTPEIHLLSEYEICKFNKCKRNMDRAKQLLNNLKLNHLNAEEQKSLQSICVKYCDIFFLDGDKLSTTNISEQAIVLKPNTSPVYVKPYRLPESQKREINKQINKMLEDDIIEESQSDWSSPILLVPKKTASGEEQKWRLVVDFRKLNENVEDDKFPLPNITEILDSLSGSVYFSHLDLQQGYYQVSLAPDSRKCTAFTTSTGQYQMKRLPMGLKTSPSSFSRVMSIAMSGLTFEKCFVYLDDLIVFGRNLEMHNKNLIDVFERLRKTNLKLNPEKCQFLKKEILYLGHVVSANGVAPDPTKISTLQNYPVPTTAEEVKRFVAFCNYYRKFVPSFADITSPLNKLCRKNEQFIWTKDCDDAFQNLKILLTTPPVLQFPDFSENNEFVIQTDASGTAIGAVLCNKDLRPIAYASRPLNKAERNYPTIQKELVAIVWAVKYFRPYVYGRFFTIMTDHRPLVYLFGMKDPSSRLLKFRLLLEEYDFKIIYIKGKDNVAADALSRICVTSDELKSMNDMIMNVMTRAQKKRMEGKDKDDELKIQNDLTTSSNDWPNQPKVVDILRKPCDSVEVVLMTGKEIYALNKQNMITKKDEYLNYIESKGIISVNLDFKAQMSRAEFVKKLSLMCEDIGIKEICIVKDVENVNFIREICEEVNSIKNWSGPRICIIRGIKKIIDENEKKFIINDFHLLPTSGHSGMRRMVNNIKRRYYWPGIEKDVQEFIQKCTKCQKMKHSRYIKEPMQITTTATSAFDKIFLDLVGPLDRDDEGNCYILTVQCELTKFIQAFPIQNKETVTVAKEFVQNFILKFGIPRVIATDRGSEFISATMEQVCKLLEIEKLCSTAYHHQSIGALENTHKHLGAFLRIQCDSHPGTWSYWLPFWTFSFNSTVHTETKYTPYELVFGKQCNIPCRINNEIDPLYNIDSYPLQLKYRLQVALKDARNNLIISKQKRKEMYDKSANPIVYAKDDLVLLKNETGRKLDPLFDGPYTVLEDVGCNVKVIKDGKVQLVHKNRTKPYVTIK